MKVDQSQIVTSTMAVAYLARKHFPKGGPVYISGSQALVDTMKEYGFYHSKEKAQAVVAGLSTDCTYETIKNTSLMVQKGLPFFFTRIRIRLTPPLKVMFRARVRFWQLWRLLPV